MGKISRTMKAAEITNPDGSRFYTTPDFANAMKKMCPDIKINTVIGTFYCTEVDFLSLAKLKQTS